MELASTPLSPWMLRDKRIPSMKERSFLSVNFRDMPEINFYCVLVKTKTDALLFVTKFFKFLHELQTLPQ